jgi:hypothetical protein
VSSPTIRERIKNIQKEVLKGAFTPDMARENLMQLTALLGAVNDEQRQADHEYKLVLLGCLQGDEAVNKARIRAEVTPQFQRAEEARDTESLVLEMIRSMKVYLKSLDSEMHLTR